MRRRRARGRRGPRRRGRASRPTGWASRGARLDAGVGAVEHPARREAHRDLVVDCVVGCCCVDDAAGRGATLPRLGPEPLVEKRRAGVVLVGARPREAAERLEPLVAHPAVGGRERAQLVPGLLGVGLAPATAQPAGQVVEDGQGVAGAGCRGRGRPHPLHPALAVAQVPSLSAMRRRRRDDVGELGVLAAQGDRERTEALLDEREVGHRVPERERLPAGRQRADGDRLGRRERPAVGAAVGAGHDEREEARLAQRPVGDPERLDLVRLAPVLAGHERVLDLTPDGVGAVAQGVEVGRGDGGEVGHRGRCRGGARRRPG